VAIPLCRTTDSSPLFDPRLTTGCKLDRSNGLKMDTPDNGVGVAYP
jgi:hypothetical protein